MQLEELFELPEKKILDSCIFSPDSGLSYIIYECKEPEDLPIEGIIECAEYVANNFSMPKLKLAKMYVIPECIKERERFLEHINRNLNFLSKTKHRIGREIEALSILCKRVYRLLGYLEKRDLTKLFSETEKSLYERLSRDIIVLTEDNELKKNHFYTFWQRKKNQKEEDFNTDEKIVAAAFTLAEREPVVIVTRDRHIISIAEYALKNLGLPKKQIKLLINVEREFELVTTSYDFIPMLM